MSVSKQIYIWLILGMISLCNQTFSQTEQISYARLGAKTSLSINWNGNNYGDIQWQKSTNKGVSWTNIPGSISPLYEFTILTESYIRAKITTSDLCEPVYLQYHIIPVSFSADIESVGFNSITLKVSNLNLKGAKIIEHGFACNISELNTRNMTEMNRTASVDSLNLNGITYSSLKDLRPATNYNLQYYLRTEDGSMIFSTLKTFRTQTGLTWSTENWTITKTSIAARFEIPGYSAGLNDPAPVFKLGTDTSHLQNYFVSNKGDFQYSSILIPNLLANTTYYARVEANIAGTMQIINREIKTLPDYSKAAVDNTLKPITHTIQWDATKTMVPISPVGLQTEYPRILRVNADTLICSYHGGRGNDYWVNIYIQKSFDNGKTWTDPVILVDKEISNFGKNYWRFCNPEMTRLKNGWILMPFIGNGNPETNDNCHVLLMISKDNGETWGDPFIMGRGRTWEPMIVQLPNGELEMYVSSEAQWWQTANQGPQEILYARSTDNGLSWTAMQRACYSPNRRDGMPVAVVMQGNRGVMFSCEIVNDGGWGSPTFVRRDLAGEWDATPWNNSNTNYRWDIPMYTFGGAPYTIQLESGEIITSAQINSRGVWQTSYPRIAIADNSGKINLTYQTPITNLPATEGAYYNSLFVKDSETIWLVMTHSWYDGENRLKGEIQYLEGKIVKR